MRIEPLVQSLDGPCPPAATQTQEAALRLALGMGHRLRRTRQQRPTPAGVLPAIAERKVRVVAGALAVWPAEIGAGGRHVQVFRRDKLIVAADLAHK